MSSSIHRQALDKMYAQRDTLKCTDFKSTVEITHGDGSHFLLKNAIATEERFGDIEMLLVYTEHCGYFAFFREDVEFYRYKFA